MKMFFKRVSVLLLLLCILFSCEETHLNRNQYGDPIFDKIKLENGSLVFQNLEDFTEIKNLLQKKDSKFLNEWESKIKFTSFRSIYENEFQKAGIELNSDFRKLLASEDPWDINLPNFELAKIVNKDGVLKIGEKYFQYSKDYVKIITDNDANKLQQLDSYTESDARNGVFVAKVNHFSGVDPSGRTQDFSHECLSVAGSSYRTVLSDNYSMFVDDIGNAHRSYSVRIISKKMLNISVTSAQLRIYGEVKTVLSGQTSTFFTDDSMYDTSSFVITFFDVIQPLSSFPFEPILSGNWTGYGTSYGSQTTECNITFYTY